MYQAVDFKKGCIFCHALTKSKTKTHCDNCGAKLLKFDIFHRSSKYNPFNEIIEWQFRVIK